MGTFMPIAFKAHKRKNLRQSLTGAFPAFPETVTSPIQTSHSTPVTEVGQQVGQMPAQSHSELDDSIGSGHNLNVVSLHDTPEWSNGGSEPSPDQRLYPDINVSVPAI